MTPRTVALGDVAESVDYGVTASSTDQAIGPKFLRITDIQDGSVDWDKVPWCECNGRSASSARLKVGDIVFARTGATTGKSFLIRECPTDSVFASYLIRVRLGETVDPRFISHYFQTPAYWAQITQSARGVAQPGVNATTLKGLIIPLPPLAEQRRIAEVLDRAEALRAKRRAALAQLDALTQSLFLDLFNKMTESYTARLGDLAGLKRGPFGGALKKDIFVASGYKIYEQRNAIYDDFVVGRYFITERKFREMADFEVKPGDLIVSCSGTLGRVAIVPEGVEPGIINQALLRVRPDTARITAIYLKHALETPEVQTKLSGLSHGTGLQNFPPMSNIRGLHLKLPPLELQHEFARRVAAVERLKASQRAALAALDALFASLQHRAFRGEL